MRILHLTSHLNVGGIASHVLSLSTALVRRGHRVIVASGGGELEPRLAGAGVPHWLAPLATSLEFSPGVSRGVRTLAERLRREPVELLHAHTRVGQVVADRLSRRLRLPYVATWHGFYRPNLGRRLWPCTGDRTIAISEPVRRHLLAAFRVPEERVRLIPHGIDPGPFERPVEPAEQQRLRDRLGVPDGAPVIGTMARLVASKRIDRLIRILPRVRAALPQARLLIVGDGEARPRLEALAASLGLAQAVHFAGSLSETRMALSLMGVFVFLPADQEGFGLSLLEAMASARPIVAVRRGQGASWVLDQGGIGAVVEETDEAGLISAITGLLGNGDAARRAADGARAAVKERYSLNRMVDAVEQVYQELLERSLFTR
jgi:glycosyltransferase involved in cell wall biosynthesis